MKFEGIKVKKKLKKKEIGNLLNAMSEVKMYAYENQIFDRNLWKYLNYIDDSLIKH